MLTRLLACLKSAGGAVVSDKIFLDEISPSLQRPFNDGF